MTNLEMLELLQDLIQDAVCVVSSGEDVNFLIDQGQLMRNIEAKIDEINQQSAQGRD